ALCLAGSIAQRCCDTTAREAAHRGFKVLMAADAMAAMPVKGPDGVLVPHDQVHRTHLGSLNGFLAPVPTSAALTAATPARCGAARQVPERARPPASTPTASDPTG